ncbi:hypothetical protein OE88DRAFT_585477 [Heliocybe sulcata]|uniref:C2H2-type domain-containing protein n=1 Tax=Heliocybe sulcata TaxID=5364 RepID=A0A5C3N2J3_9AGAM|nr:hypothetical protein OE88DRAFT_585477 [Heliocybe sulcata]
MSPTYLAPHAHHYSNNISRPSDEYTHQIANVCGFLNGSSYQADHGLYPSQEPVPSDLLSSPAYMANAGSSYAYSESTTNTWNDPRSVAVGFSDRIFAWNTQIQSNLLKGSVVVPPSSPEIPAFTGSMAIQPRSRNMSPSVPTIPAPFPRRPLPVSSALMPPSASSSLLDTRFTEGVLAQPDPPRPNSDVGQSAAAQSADNTRVKEKKHGCWMCHKSFDRPSTLRKHLLVHTGEKAHACNICGRRFGVLSNLNRHVRRCAQKPVNKGSSSGSLSDPHSPAADLPADSGSGATLPAQSAISVPMASQHSIYTSAERSTASPDAVALQSTSRKRESSRSPSQTDPSMALEQRPKRRRRAPSPSRWIPPSLSNFNLSHYPKSVPVPLPPATEGYFNGVWEERNSFDENTSSAPYHPNGWKGKLPGPGLVAKDVSNTSALGKVLVF